MVFHDFYKFRRNSDFFEKSSGKIFLIRGFVDVSGDIILVWFSIDFIYIFLFFLGKLCKFINSYISLLIPKRAIGSP